MAAWQRRSFVWSDGFERASTTTKFVVYAVHRADDAIPQDVRQKMVRRTSTARTTPSVIAPDAGSQAMADPSKSTDFDLTVPIYRVIELLSSRSLL